MAAFDASATLTGSPTTDTHAPQQTGPRTPLEIHPTFCPTDVDSPFDTTEWDLRTAAIKGEDGKVLFEQTACEIPAAWSQLATNVVVSKYFYGEIHTPEREHSVKQLVHRVARTIADWGIKDGYFKTKQDGENFYRDLAWLCVHQHGAFNSPVWFNVGLYNQYGVKGAPCNWRWDESKRDVVMPDNPYEFPQGSACFIQSVRDNMEDIMELARSEAMLFKFGSGTGTDLSTIRSQREKLAGGGKPSGPLSFMRVYDQVAAVVKSGGKTRRAAKMQSLKVMHPDIMEFIECKSKEEKKARVLIEKGGYDANFNGEAYSSILFQNANLSVRLTDDFMEAVERDDTWTTRWVTDPSKAGPSFKAHEVINRMSECAWQCGDPGVQYDTTINHWHTCPNSGRINASNPCVTGDTLVSTDEGLVRIDELVGSRPEVVGLDGNLHPTTRVIPTGTKPVYRLRTASGYELKLTADHRVWTVNRGDVPACELTKDDRVRLGGVRFGSESLDADVAEYVGLMLGDGSVSCGRDGRPIATLTVDPEQERGVAERMVAVATCAESVTTLLARYAVLDEGSACKRLTADGLRLDRATTAAVLRGVFTADGTVADYGKKSQYVALDSTSEELLKQVQVLLLGFGIKAKIYRNRRIGSTALLPDGRGGMKEYAVEQVHSLRISRTGRIAFEREIGFASESPKAAALAALNERVGVRRERMFDAVVSLEYLGEEPVYDLTEPATDHFVADGIVVHNCSEYMFLDDTACNLASINLMKFRKPDGHFDVERFAAACRLFLVAQEILVDHASYPTPRIARNSHLFRPLGLGYSNLGSVLMANGLAYDSDAGRGLCGAITAILHGTANRTSAELAAAVGPFDGFAANREPMLNVMQMHREAVEQIDDSCPEYLHEAARKIWNDVLEGGRRHGYRNAQATVLAPTGTISFLMDCDTTGIEPDIALVKYKQLAGGGMLKIVNQTVPLALRTLGYDEPTVEGVLAYIDKNDTVEGAPGLKGDHLSVFDCAFKPRLGERSIAWEAHVKMMAAAQPFISGAISKTVNMPRETTPADIARAYIEGWRLGLKALAIYRDGSKESQPLSTSTEGDKAAAKTTAAPRRERLPDTRRSVTHKFNVGGHEGYITVGLYDDGRPGELFITMAKEGSTIGGLMDAFGTAVSMSLQYGVPLEVYAKKFSHTRFEPWGYTKNPDIPVAKSLVDYIFRWMATEFIPGYREANRPAGHGDSGGGEAAAAGDSESELKPAAMKASGLADGHGKTTNGRASGNGETKATKHSAVKSKIGGATAVLSDRAMLLEKAGLKMAVDPSASATDREGQFASFQIDAPACDNCGAITVRNGNCYLCHNCGNSMGCS
jgi:ribonucleoside-diphosphate reductase alpha chain